MNCIVKKQQQKSQTRYIIFISLYLDLRNLIFLFLFPSRLFSFFSPFPPLWCLACSRVFVQEEERRKKEEQLRVVQRGAETVSGFDYLCMTMLAVLSGVFLYFLFSFVCIYLFLVWSALHCSAVCMCVCAYMSAAILTAKTQHLDFAASSNLRDESLISTFISSDMFKSVGGREGWGGIFKVHLGVQIISMDRQESDSLISVPTTISLETTWFN